MALAGTLKGRAAPCALTPSPGGVTALVGAPRPPPGASAAPSLQAIVPPSPFPYRFGLFELDAHRRTAAGRTPRPPPASSRCAFSSAR